MAPVGLLRPDAPAIVIVAVAIGAGVPPGEPTSSVAYVLAALLAGGLLAFAFQAYMRFRKGPIEDAIELQRASDVARKASAELYSSYRVELEGAQRQMHDYLDQLLSVSRQLGAAEVRIKRLEEELVDARAESGALRNQLAEAMRSRDALHQQVTELRSRVDELSS